jgi:hypothetical protein
MHRILTADMGSMTMRVTGTSDLRFVDRLRAAGVDVAPLPTVRPSAAARDRVVLSSVARPASAAPTLWQRLTQTVTSWLPNWLSPSPKPSSNRTTVTRVGHGYHIIGSLPSAARKDGHGVDPQAKTAFEAMTAAAAREGVVLTITSSYRSYAHQARLFAKSDGSGHWVAAPGKSEHQTGLTFDIGTRNYSGGKSGNFGKSPAYRWLQENGYRFGFVQSMSWEPWHWRFDPQAVQRATGQALA